MVTYQRKPLVVQAMQLADDNYEAFTAFVAGGWTDTGAGRMAPEFYTKYAKPGLWAVRNGDRVRFYDAERFAEDFEPVSTTTQDVEYPLPCVICNGVVGVWERVCFRVECRDCGRRTHERRTRAEAVRDWNRGLVALSRRSG